MTTVIVTFDNEYSRGVGYVNCGGSLKDKIFLFQRKEASSLLVPRSDMKNDIGKYLRSLYLKYPEYHITPEDKAVVAKAGVATFIERHIFSNKYRKSAPTDAVTRDIKKRIRDSVRSGKPIHLTIPTGGYKKWQLPTAPKVDWAELFHLRMMLEYMAPIAAGYEPGVMLDYFSNAWLIKIISHYPQSDLDAYTKSFRDLLEKFKSCLPNNIQIRYNVVADQRDEKELLRRTLTNRPIVEKNWGLLSKVERQERLTYSERNIRWDIVDPDNKLGQSERNRIIYEGKIIHDCLLMGGWNQDLYYLRSENGIGIIHRNSDPYFLHLATIPGSFVQFWVGTGILEIVNGRIKPRVLSYQQHINLRPKLEKVIVNVVNGGMGYIEVIESSQKDFS